MKVFIPKFKGNVQRNYLPQPTEHIIGYIDPTVVSRVEGWKGMSVNFLELEIPEPKYFIKETSSALVSRYLHNNYLISENDVIVVRPLYATRWRCLLTDTKFTDPNQELNTILFVQFEKEMETNTDKEVLIPISLYESLVNQGFS